MKEIVIISEQGWVNHELISLLTALFPECNISIVSADRQDFKPYPGGFVFNGNHGRRNRVLNMPRILVLGKQLRPNRSSYDGTSRPHTQGPTFRVEKPRQLVSKGS